MFYLCSVIYNDYFSFRFAQTVRQSKPSDRQTIAVAQPHGRTEALLLGTEQRQRRTKRRCRRHNDAQSIAHAQQTEHDAKADGADTDEVSKSCQKPALVVTNDTGP